MSTPPNTPRDPQDAGESHVPSTARARRDPVEASRMTLGEHLDELRACVFRSLVALVLACVLLIWPARYLFEFMVRPAVIALRSHGQPENLLQTGPTELLTIYFRVVLIAGVILASPYILHQLWTFVAAGLYPKEQRWVRRLVPFSVGLFLLGVAFMYAFVLLLSLDWLVGFGSWIPLPHAEPTALERTLIGQAAPQTPASQPALWDTPPIVLVEHDPKDPPVGRLWFNVIEHKLKLRAVDQVYSAPMAADTNRPIVTTYFKVGDYLSFVLSLTIAFGLAFQVPLVVMALARIGIVTRSQFRRLRRVVWFIIVVAAGVLAPPDILSMILLTVPMILLFELGLLLAGRAERARPTASAPPTGS
jgi:Sec-independent protein secretion pathway component TatC